MASTTFTGSPSHGPAATLPQPQPPLGQQHQPRPRPEERLCEQLIALIEQGVNPWRKPWSSSRCGRHRNLLTGRAYTGSNPALLELQLSLRATDLPLWIGHQQAAQQEIGNSKVIAQRLQSHHTIAQRVSNLLNSSPSCNEQTNMRG